jgi:hypothetical protein
MPVYDLFTHRLDAVTRADQPEVYVYDKMPEQLVGQIVHIWRDHLEPERYYEMPNNRNLEGRAIWEFSNGVLWREYGMLSWPWRRGDFEGPSGPDDDMIRFFLKHATNDQRLNIVEITFRFIARAKGGGPAVKELNERFKRAGVGYQFEGKDLIRMDSTVAHEEIVKPTLVLLGKKGFEQADEQYRAAHNHYRMSEYPQAVTEAGKAFESALKAICPDKGWKYEKGARATDLIKVVVKEGLFPGWLENGLSAYVAMMKTGLPGVRNEAGPHGTAPDAAPVHDYLARYALHMSASNIRMVAEAAAKHGSK